MTKDFITVFEGMSGFFAVHIWLNKDEESVSGPFWEPYQSGWGRYTTREEAVAEARKWAEETGMECRV